MDETCNTPPDEDKPCCLCGKPIGSNESMFVSGRAGDVRHKECPAPAPDPAGTSEGTKPERRWTLTLKAGGDTRDDVLALLREFLNCIEDGSDGSVTGGYSLGGHYELKERPDVTHASYQQALDNYLEANR